MREPVPHYTAGMPDGIEVIDVIRSQGWETNYYLANACKYLLRCEHKGQKESDIRKAITYLTWELERMGRGMLEVSAQDEE